MLRVYHVLSYTDTPTVGRKAFPNAAALGRSVFGYNPPRDRKAIDELARLWHLYIRMISKSYHMATAKKPHRQQPATAGKRPAEPSITGARKPEAERRRSPTTLRFDPELLARIDAAAKRRGISRSAWIQYTLSQALDEKAS